MSSTKKILSVMSIHEQSEDASHETVHESLNENPTAAIPPSPECDFEEVLKNCLNIGNPSLKKDHKL